MDLKILPVGSYQANCYSLKEGDDLLLVDAGDEAEKIIAHVEELGISPKYILLTHGHFDHTSAVKAVKNAYPSVEVYIHAGDGKDAPPEMFPLAQELSDLNFFKDGDKLPFGDDFIHVLATPGHSLGSVCLQYHDLLFTGDTLFCGSMGRTDFAGGSYGEIMKSLARLAKLPDCQVFPGHDRPTTMDRERKSNPYLLEAMRN